MRVTECNNRSVRSLAVHTSTALDLVPDQEDQAMRATRLATVAALLTCATLASATPAEAWVIPTKSVTSARGTIVEVVNHLPRSWPVSNAVNWVDKYTASDMLIVKRCTGHGRRCITIKPGYVAGGPFGWSSNGKTITIDIKDAARTRAYGYYTRLYLLDHELGHMFGLHHSTSCSSRMYKYARCRWGGVPPRSFTKYERKVLATK